VVCLDAVFVALSGGKGIKLRNMLEGQGVGILVMDIRNRNSETLNGSH
jgi:hypothetical protein